MHSNEHTLDLRVYFEDTDAGGIVYYANYLKFTERARTEWLRSLGYSGPEFASRYGAAFVVRRVEADYLHPARLEQLVRVTTRLLSLKRATLALQQNLVDALQPERIFCRTRVQLVCVRIESMQPCAIPAAIHTCLNSID